MAEHNCWVLCALEVEIFVMHTFSLERAMEISPACRHSWKVCRGNLNWQYLAYRRGKTSKQKSPPGPWSNAKPSLHSQSTSRITTALCQMPILLPDKPSPHISSDRAPLAPRCRRLC